MDLMTKLFAKALESQKITVSFADKDFDLRESMESVSIAALRRIREILTDATLDDAECFQRIVDIVCVFEDLGLDCGVRHDFG